ncbi:GNAT family N-acetyltransferase [Microbacterium murale]|uniref:GNAT superfamily N-acetyltransferase n=1 Tax=Microbacterium murale TaxID=1081040 RepID=A0ABU0P3L4_9MICO|nr:GNAT family N-acetyltransferase [Microbacterium murale]MDQ0641929.1 GNAT superfamily N-acetyltransferase [Microbacterium murale]
MLTHAEVRFADAEDFGGLEEIETAADNLFVSLFSATDWPPTTPATERAEYPGFTLLLRREDAGTVGFVQVLESEGFAHLEQLSVIPEYGRLGYGRMLVTAAKSEALSRGHRELTLRTYRDVPWNAPFYATCGFEPSIPTSEFHLRLVDVETRLRLERWGPRIQMTAPLFRVHP